MVVYIYIFGRESNEILLNDSLIIINNEQSVPTLLLSVQPPRSNYFGGGNGIIGFQFYSFLSGEEKA